jgi:DNA mismatch endonuclease (patch repair protein)
MIVRRVLHGLGLRFRLHRKDLPGTPDIVLPKHRAAMFVHGCFWHRHEGCRKATTPKTSVEFWQTKFEQNIRRDRRNAELLLEKGWTVVTVWECQASRRDELQSTLALLFGLRQHQSHSIGTGGEGDTDGPSIS